MHILPKMANGDAKLRDHVGDTNKPMTPTFGKHIDVLYRNLTTVSHRTDAYGNTVANNKVAWYDSLSEPKRQQNRSANFFCSDSGVG